MFRDDLVVPRKTRWLWLLAAVYVGSFFLPIQVATGHSGSMEYGYHLFVWGAVCFWCLPLTWPWWANVFFWWGYVALAVGSFSSVRAAGVIASALAAGYVPYAVGGMPAGLAYLAWAAAMILLAVAGFQMKKANVPDYDYAERIMRGRAARRVFWDE